MRMKRERAMNVKVIMTNWTSKYGHLSMNFKIHILEWGKCRRLPKFF